jgi:hypothetical protein
MNEDKELFLPDTTVKLGTLRRVLNDTYGLDIIKLKMATNTEIASIIVNQLGGIGRLNMMTGAYNFVALPNGVTFRIKNQRANVIKITLTSMDLYNLEVGRLRGGKYTIVTEKLGLYNDMLKPAIEKATGMYLSLQDGGTLVSERRFTDYDFDKLMESGLFRANRSITLQDIYPIGRSGLVGKFNSDKEYLYISGKKDLSNPLVEWLSENSYVTSDEYRSLAKGSTLRASKSPLLEFTKFEDNWVINLVKLNPNRNQKGLLYKGENKYAVVRNSDKGKQEIFEFKTLEQAEDKFDKLVIQSTTYSPISKRGKIEGNYADGGGIGGTFDSSGTGEVIGGTFGSSESGEMIGGTMASSIYKNGGSIPYIVWTSKDDIKRDYFGEYKSMKSAQNIAKKLIQNGDYESVGTKSKSQYEKEMDLYANGGGIGGTSDSADMNAPMIGGTMSSSMFEGGSYDNKFENKLWNEMANGTPHSFKKGGKLGDCGCKKKIDEHGKEKCGCWHYDIGGL